MKELPYLRDMKDASKADLKVLQSSWNPAWVEGATESIALYQVWLRASQQCYGPAPNIL